MNNNELGKEFTKFAKTDYGLDVDSLIKVVQPTMMGSNPYDFQSIAGNAEYSNVSSSSKIPTSLTPAVIEERQLNVTAISVFDRLMMERIIFLGMPINDHVANIIVAQLLFMNSVDSETDIEMYINSPGGGVYSGLAIYDAMHYIDCDVATTCTGLAASMAFVLAVSGAKGKRVSLPNSRFMQHQPLGGASGQASDIEITAKEIGFLKERLYKIISAKTGQDYETIWKDADRDFWMSPKEALKYGCIDEIIENNDGVEY